MPDKGLYGTGKRGGYNAPIDNSGVGFYTHNGGDVVCYSSLL